MSDEGFVVLGMVASMALMVFGIIAAKCLENVQHHKIEANKLVAEAEAVDAEVIELEWSSTRPTEFGFYWFKGTIIDEGIESKHEIGLYTIWTDGDGDKMIDYQDLNGGWSVLEDRSQPQFSGYWAKLEKPL